MIEGLDSTSKKLVEKLTIYPALTGSKTST